MEVFIGVDVSLATSNICVLEDGGKGKVLIETKIASEPAAFVDFFMSLEYEIKAIGLEAGPLSQWLYKVLTEAGFEVVLMETRRVKAALNAAPVKTDRRDANGIAHLLKLGWFSEVHCSAPG